VRSGDSLGDRRVRVEQPERQPGRRRLGEVLAASRRIAEMKACGRPVRSRAYLSARRSFRRENALTTGRDASMTAPPASISSGRPAMSARDCRPSGAHQRRAPRPQHPNAASSSPNSSDQPLQDVAVDVVRHLVRQDDLDLVVRVVGQQRVRQQDPAGAARADQRGVRPPRLLAQPPLEHAQHGHAGRCDNASSRSRSAGRSSGVNR
jgi:hypothetical protein